MKLFLFFAVTALASESNSVSETKDDSDCVCDITAESCDVYCCCDTDCKSSFRSDWEDLDNAEDDLCLAPRFTNYVDSLCTSEKFEQVHNTRRGIQKAVSQAFQSLLCIKTDNSPTEQKFFKEETEFDESDTRLEDNVEYSDRLVVDQFEGGSSYTSGDRIPSLISDVNRYDNRLRLPAPDAYGNCSDLSSAQFLIPEELGWCSYRQPAADICTSLLKPSTYTSDLKVAKTPAKEEWVPVTVKVVTKTDLSTYDTTTMTSLPSSTLNSDGDNCNNALLEIVYNIYTNADMDEIEAVWAFVTVASTTIGGVARQRSTVRWFTNGTPDESTTTDVDSTDEDTVEYFVRSGNPGYHQGKNVIFANQNSGEAYVFEGGVPLLGANKDGSCSQTIFDQRDVEKITFGQETIFTCFLEMNYSELASYCNQVSSSRVLIFDGHQQVTHVGKFGNIDPTVEDDWVAIDTNEAPIASWNNEKCDIAAVLTYNIITLEVGATINPQTKIVKAERKYEKIDWKFLSRDQTKKQKFFYHLVVNFIPYGQDDDFWSPSPPNPIPTMPDDVMYPFKVDFASVMALAILMSLIQKMSKLITPRNNGGIASSSLSDITTMYKVCRNLTEDFGIQEYKTPKCQIRNNSISYGVPQDKSSGFIDSVIRKSKKVPAPDAYNLNPSWVTKNGTTTKGARITQTDVINKRERSLPGPASYMPSRPKDRAPGFAMNKEENVGHLSETQFRGESVPAAANYDPLYEKLRHRSPHFWIAKPKPKKPDEKSRIGPGSYNETTAYLSLRQSPRRQRFIKSTGREIFEKTTASQSPGVGQYNTDNHSKIWKGSVGRRR